MADIKKVIKGLECCKAPICTNADCPYKPWDRDLQCKEELFDDTLELLKELIDERHYYEEWKEGYGNNKPQIVRCKDCKHYKDGRCFFTMRRYGLHDDWYCADGERKPQN